MQSQRVGFVLWEFLITPANKDHVRKQILLWKGSRFTFLDQKQALGAEGSLWPVPVMLITMFTKLSWIDRLKTGRTVDLWDRSCLALTSRYVLMNPYGIYCGTLTQAPWHGSLAWKVLMCMSSLMWKSSMTWYDLWQEQKYNVERYCFDSHLFKCLLRKNDNFIFKLKTLWAELEQ